MDLLKNGLISCCIPENLIEEASGKMDKYIKEIILFNSAYNLTNTSEYDELVVRHLLDSLAAYKELCALTQSFSGQPVVFADIGSGGGLPGIPLAVVFILTLCLIAGFSFKDAKRLRAGKSAQE